MNLRSLIVSTFGAALLTQVAAPAGAVSLIDENFNGATQGLNATSGLPNFSVTSGNVDVIGPGFNDYYPGNGNKIDLNGNTSGTLTSSAFSFALNDLVTLSFDYGRNGGGTKADVFLGTTLLAQLTGPSGVSYSPYSYSFTATNAFNGALSFVSTSPGGGGIILDNIQLTSVAAVPEPTEIPGLLLFGGAAIVLRRKQLTKNAKVQLDS
jgi:hypothetical protein